MHISPVLLMALGVVDQHVDAALRDVDADAVAVAHQADRAAGRGLGRAMADRQGNASPRMRLR